MKTLLRNLLRHNPEDPPNNYKIREECAAGTLDENFLPARIYLATNKSQKLYLLGIERRSRESDFPGVDLLYV